MGCLISLDYVSFLSEYYNEKKIRDSQMRSEAMAAAVAAKASKSTFRIDSRLKCVCFATILI